MIQPVEAIIFDLGGVVLNLNYNLTIQAFKELGRENFDTLYAQSYQDQIFDKFEIGAISAQEFRNYMKAFFENPPTDEHIDQAWNAMLLDLPARRIDLLQQLKKDYRIFLFSNTNEIHLDAFKQIISDEHGDANLLESLFEQTYYSHLVGKRKPNAEAFLQVIQDHELNAEKTLFIDDSAQHIEGAGKLGIQTIHLVNTDICDLFPLKTS